MVFVLERGSVVNTIWWKFGGFVLVLYLATGKLGGNKGGFRRMVDGSEAAAAAVSVSVSVFERI